MRRCVYLNTNLLISSGVHIGLAGCFKNFQYYYRGKGLIKLSNHKRSHGTKGEVRTNSDMVYIHNNK